MIAECAAAILGAFAIVQTARLMHYQKLLFPPGSVNVINGIIYPTVDDLRWERDFDDDGEDYFLNEIVVRHIPWSGDCTVFVDGEETYQGRAAKPYWLALERSYQQRMAMKAIEGPDESVLALEALEKKEKAAARRAAREARKKRRR